MNRSTYFRGQEKELYDFMSTASVYIKMGDSNYAYEILSKGTEYMESVLEIREEKAQDWKRDYEKEKEEENE